MGLIQINAQLKDPDTGERPQTRDCINPIPVPGNRPSVDVSKQNNKITLKNLIPNSESKYDIITMTGQLIKSGSSAKESEVILEQLEPWKNSVLFINTISRGQSKTFKIPIQ